METPPQQLNNGSTTSWLEPVPLAYRRRRGLVAIAAGLALAVVLWVLQSENGSLDVRAGFGLIPVAIGIYRYRVWMRKEPVRRYATVYVPFSRRTRLMRAGAWVAPPLLACMLAWAVQYFSEQLVQYWWYTWPLWLVSFIGVGRYFQRGEHALTADALKEKSWWERVEEEKAPADPAWMDTFESLIGQPAVRYPIAAALIWLAYDLGDDVDAKQLHIVALLLMAAFAARELVLWLLGAGLLIGLAALLFQGVAALPVSVAVIIGALIIAAAVKK